MGLVTAEPIACAACLEQGIAHLKAITETGGAVLDARSLALHGMSPERSRNQHGTNGAGATQGYRYIRMAAEGGTHACGQSRGRPTRR